MARDVDKAYAVIISAVTKRDDFEPGDAELKWDADGLRAEFRSVIEGGKRHQADLKSRISKGDPTASKDLYDETLGESMFAGLYCKLDFISSPGPLVQFLTTHDPGKIQFLAAYNARVARAAYRRSHKALLIKAKAALG